ncbi:MAG: methylaspartate mutase accessory protein GlmL [Alphaproteobacteria bacterium]|jgi:uncharacterized protein (TIGR01319 family)|nr:methylaspartate mutase accessory protein GlmL [Alphaproteobacteria bacterium]MDP6253106.1 methylaspartate mutase accessory protein GlmL [Alphaproteobacteria bacterium]|tara:strand:+ start:1981 stop:3408 length:1428 start_codon:yes stop_codon:yes gene_type:complete
MPFALLIDFGSTYTKLRAIDMGIAKIVASGQGASTVTTDINDGLDAALNDLKAHLGILPEFDYRLASSSAAGGLRMTTVGLVPDLTAKAARLAALGAGAKVAGTYSFELTSGDIDTIINDAPDILLLSGGTDGGNTKVIEHNAHKLSESALACPVIIAGNRNAADTVADCLSDARKRVIVTENVMPRHLELNIEPAREAIRQVFIEHIVHAKGIDKAQGRFDSVLMPTPAAVLEGAQLLAGGQGGKPGLGPLLVVDIGGATTDVHSICDGLPSESGVIYHGLPEPHAKRTVEGDLGMRHTARHVVLEAGLESFAGDADISTDEVEALLARTDGDVEWLPKSDAERRFDIALARTATRVSVTRHAGTIEAVYTATGPVSVQRGKDLGEVETIIGTGGVLVHNDNPAAILDAALAGDEASLALRPRNAGLTLDDDYILYACGLLRSVAPDVALELGLKALKPLTNHKELGNAATGPQ